MTAVGIEASPPPLFKHPNLPLSFSLRLLAILNPSSLYLKQARFLPSNHHFFRSAPSFTLEMADQTSSMAGSNQGAPIAPLKKRLLQQFVEASSESTEAPSETDLITVQPLCTVFPVSSSSPNPSESVANVSAAEPILVTDSDEEAPSEKPAEKQKEQPKESVEAVNARLRRRQEILAELRSWAEDSPQMAAVLKQVSAEVEEPLAQDAAKETPSLEEVLNFKEPTIEEIVEEMGGEDDEKARRAVQSNSSTIPAEPVLASERQDGEDRVELPAENLMEEIFNELDQQQQAVNAEPDYTIEEEVMLWIARQLKKDTKRKKKEVMRLTQEVNLKRKRREEAATKRPESPIDPELEALFGDDSEAPERRNEERVGVSAEAPVHEQNTPMDEVEGREGQPEAQVDEEEEREEPLAKKRKVGGTANAANQVSESATGSPRQDNRRPREIKPELGIARDFALPNFIYESLHALGWSSYLLDGTELIHPEMLRFAYSCPMAKDKDEISYRGHAIPFDEATINEELEFSFEDYPGDALIWNPTREDLQRAVREMGVEGARLEETVSGVQFLPSGLLSPEAGFWNYWIKNRIFPTTHDKRVSSQRLMAAYCMHKGLRFNLGRVLAGEIRNIHDRTRGPLFLPGLFQRLVERAGGEPRPSDFKSVKGLIDRRSMRRILKNSQFCPPPAAKSKKATVAPGDKGKRQMTAEEEEEVEEHYSSDNRPETPSPVHYSEDWPEDDAHLPADFEAPMDTERGENASVEEGVEKEAENELEQEGIATQAQGGTGDDEDFPEGQQTHFTSEPDVQDPPRPSNEEAAAGPSVEQAAEYEEPYEVQDIVMEMFRWHIMKPLAEGQLALARRMALLSDAFSTDPEDLACGPLLDELRRPINMPNFGPFFPPPTYAPAPTPAPSQDPLNPPSRPENSGSSSSSPEF